MESQFPLAPKVVTLISNHTLTANYTDTGASGVVETNFANFVGLMIAYTKGTEASCNIKVEGTVDKSLGILLDTDTPGGTTQASLASATNWFQRVVETTSSGVTTLTADVFQLSASGNYSENITPVKGDGIRVSVLGNTLSTSPGTITIYGVISWV